MTWDDFNHFEGIGLLIRDDGFYRKIKDGKLYYGSRDYRKAMQEQTLVAVEWVEPVRYKLLTEEELTMLLL